MLDATQLAHRLRLAMDNADPRVSSVQVASACKVTPQAVNGWRKNGRLAKRHLPTIAALTKRPVEYFLGVDEGKISTNYGLTVTHEEAEALKRLHTALPDWRTYVLGLAMIDNKATQELLLKTMRQAVPDRRVEDFIPVAPHAAARRR